MTMKMAMWMAMTMIKDENDNDYGYDDDDDDNHDDDNEYDGDDDDDDNNRSTSLGANIQNSKTLKKLRRRGLSGSLTVVVAALHTNIGHSPDEEEELIEYSRHVIFISFNKSNIRLRRRGLANSKW